MFSGGIERDQLHKMGYGLRYFINVYQNLCFQNLDFLRKQRNSRIQHTETSLLLQ